MNTPAISIIVPIYNTEKDLPRCLESLINQSFGNLEIICVIDGSPDNSLDICKKYKNKDNRIVIICQENQGVAGARNTGVTNAKGEYIQFCDPDDYFAPDMCETVYKAITLSSADLAVTGIKVFYDHVNYVPDDDYYYRIKNRALCPVNEAVFCTTDCSLCNKIFRKSVIDAYSIKFPVGLNYEDACFFYKYMYVSKTIYYVPEYLYNYIRHDNSIMSNTFQKTAKAIDHVKILEDINIFMVKNRLDGSYERDVFLGIIVSYMRLIIRYGIESIYSSAVETVSNLLKDFSEEFIKSCPYVAAEGKLSLIHLKNNDVESFLRGEIIKPRHQKLKAVITPFFPPGTKRRMLLKKIYRKIMMKH